MEIQPGDKGKTSIYKKIRSLSGTSTIHQHQAVKTNISAPFCVTASGWNRGTNLDKD